MSKGFKIIRHCLFTALILALTSAAFSNSPSSVPWPVGSTEAMMNSSKTLLNSYGDPQNDWTLGSFHCGIDLDYLTEPPLGTTLVRCVHGSVAPAPATVVITSLDEPDYSNGSLQYVVVTTEGTGQSNHEDFGWCYQHLTNPLWTTTPDGNGWTLWEQIGEGQLIASMHTEPTVSHTHFKWTDWNFSNSCYVNPLNWLNPEPSSGDGYTWTFNPSGYTQEYEIFFLDQVEPGYWPSDPDDVTFLDESDLDEDVDIFLGYGLSGVGQTTTSGCGRNDLAAERIEWSLHISTTAGFQLLESNYLVNFDCSLNNQFNQKVQQLYFRHDLDNLFSYTTGGNEGLVVCLTNCGDLQGWENLGIDNIEENWW